jgi:hypothetical protein
MISDSVSLDHISTGRLMRNGHRFFIFVAVIACALDETLVTMTLFTKGLLFVDFLLACSLLLLVLMPLLAAAALYIKMKRAASIGKADVLDWPLVRFWGALMVLLFYISITMAVALILSLSSQVQR